jgi:hypothetical protein
MKRSDDIWDRALIGYVYEPPGNRVGTFHHVYFAVKTPIDDSQYGPCNQSDTRE